MLTDHADRRTARLRAAGMPDATIAKCVESAERFAEHRRSESCAVLIGTLPRPVGLAWSETSNGNQVWAIIRQRKVVTLMLRRSNQPSTPEALSVREVIA